MVKSNITGVNVQKIKFKNNAEHAMHLRNVFLSLIFFVEKNLIKLQVLLYKLISLLNKNYM